MLPFLKKHPFPVEAFFDSSMVLTFAFPKEQLQDMLPDCLELDTFQDRWGFVAVAMVRTRGLRPKGFPAFMGNDFFLTGYRIFVRYTNQRGKRLRGLYILKSETDKLKMRVLGSVFTHYNYGLIDISYKEENGRILLSSQKSGFHVELRETEIEAAIPEDSPFSSWKEARRFAGPLPFTFTYLPKRKEVVIIQGVRQNWIPKPIEVVDYSFKFVDDLGLKGRRLASAFVIRDIPYHWKKGVTETWGA